MAYFDCELKPMHGFLKCYYGFQNLGDELLFWGVVDYIDQCFDHVQQLTVEVGDVERMQTWRDKNSALMKSLGLAPHFLSGAKTINFLPLSKNILDNRRYDLYFFGGGEVFAQSRGFYGGRNYLLRYPWPIISKKFVLLGGVERATSRWQRLLYRLVLPRAQSVVCREVDSHQESLCYTSKAQFHQDFSLAVLDAFRQRVTATKLQDFLVEKPYIIINIVQSQSTDKTYERLHRLLTSDYSDCTPVYVSGKSRDSDDQAFALWLQGVYPKLRIFHWQDYNLQEILTLFQGARAGIASRLHILLLLQEFEKPLHALVYAPKVKKLIHSSLDF